LNVLLLGSNKLSGELGGGALPRHLDILTLSDNRLQGPIPEDYGRLHVFHAGERGF
ncbi:unnamed protein product, partial [Discosporangium mesarthrocarpum]